MRPRKSMAYDPSKRVIADSLRECQVAVNDEDMSDPGDGPPTDVPKEPEVPNESQEEENSQ